MKQPRFGLVEFIFVSAITMLIILVVGIYKLNERFTQQKIQSDTTSLATTTESTPRESYRESYGECYIFGDSDKPGAVTILALPIPENGTEEEYRALCEKSKEEYYAKTESEVLSESCLYNDSDPNYELMEEVDASIPPQENPTREASLARNCAMAKEYHRRKEALKQEEKRLYKAWCAAQDPSRMSFEDYKSCKRDIR